MSDPAERTPPVPASFVQGQPLDMSQRRESRNNGKQHELLPDVEAVKTSVLAIQGRRLQTLDITEDGANAVDMIMAGKRSPIKSVVIIDDSL